MKSHTTTAAASSDAAVLKMDKACGKCYKYNRMHIWHPFWNLTVASSYKQKQPNTVSSRKPNTVCSNNRRNTPCAISSMRRPPSNDSTNTRKNTSAVSNFNKKNTTVINSGRQRNSSASFSYSLPMPASSSNYRRWKLCVFYKSKCNARSTRASLDKGNA